MKTDVFESRALLLAVALLLLASPLVILQAFIFGDVLLTGKAIKVFAGLAILAMFLARVSAGFSMNSALLMCISCLFFLYNAWEIIIGSSLEVGVPRAWGAFFYNYSLLLIVLPYFWMARLPIHEASNKTSIELIKNMALWLIVLSELFGVLQFTLNEYIYSQEVVKLLTEGDHIKFDQIGGLIRVGSVFKSPLEFGLICALISGIAYAKLWTKRKIILLWGLFLLSSLCVFITISRTVMVVYACNILLITGYLVWSHWRQKFSLKTAIGLYLIMMLLAAVAMSLVWGGRYFETSMNPTNFMIRLENWGRILGGLGDSGMALLFGFGIVQNGAYGDYHSVIIDNTYLGAMMTGGIFGALLLFALLLQVLRQTWKHVEQLHLSEKMIGVSFLTFLIAFLVGGMAENLMHIMFYPIVCQLLLSLLPQITSKIQDSVHQEAVQ